MVKGTLKKIQDVRGYPCVSILFNTHRTHSENAQDQITLKNLVKQAEERILHEFNRRPVLPILEKLEELPTQIDHNKNLESMAIFVNEKIAEVVRLPLSVENRVIIDHAFATRDLVRKLHQSSRYFVLTLGQRKVRLLSAYNDELIGEFHDHGFPFKNEYLYSTHKHELSTAKGTYNLHREFFNRAAKELEAVVKADRRYMIVASEERNFHFFKEVFPEKDLIAGHINRSREEDKAQSIVRDAWVQMSQFLEHMQDKALSRLVEAENKNLTTAGILEIQRAAQEGRGAELLVEIDYYQPALQSNGDIHLINNPHRPGAIDDLVDHIVHDVIAHGGNISFIDNGRLAIYRRMALINRY